MLDTMPRKKPRPVPEGDKAPKNTINVGIPRSLHAELKQLAEEDERSINWMAARIIRQWVEQRKQQKKS